MKIISILIISLFLTSICYADKLVIYDKINDKYVNDFQSNASSETLIENAIQGGRDSSEFSVEIVTDEEYIRLEKETNEPMRKQKQAEHEKEKTDKETKKIKVMDKLEDIGFTVDEIDIIMERN